MYPCLLGEVLGETLGCRIYLYMCESDMHVLYLKKINEFRIISVISADSNVMGGIVGCTVGDAWSR